MRSCIGMGSVPCGNANLETQGLKPARSFHRYLAPPLRVARRSTGGLAENNSSHFCHAPDIPAGRPQSGFGGGGDAASRRAPRRIPDPPSAPRPTGGVCEATALARVPPIHGVEEAFILCVHLGHQPVAVLWIIYYKCSFIVGQYAHTHSLIRKGCIAAVFALQ